MYTFLLSVSFCFGQGQEATNFPASLGHPSYSVREKAQAKFLEKIDFNIYLEFKKLKPSDPEIVSRKKYILATFEQKLRAKYEVDLKGYPQYPWIFEGYSSEKFPSNYKWGQLERWDIFSDYSRIVIPMGLPMHRFPDYPGYRKITELWMTDRINLEFYRALHNAKSKDELTNRMKACMEEIQQDIQLLTEHEDNWWKTRRKENPLRIVGKK